MNSADTTPLFGSNASFVEGLYEDFLADPASVSEDWRSYFSRMQIGAGAPDVAHGPVQRAFAALVANGPQAQAAAAPGTGTEAPFGAGALINAYRYEGHLKARISPLALRPSTPVPELELSFYGLTEAALDGHVKFGALSGTLREVIAQLEATYCGTIGFECGYLPTAERLWLQARIEPNRAKGSFDKATKRQILKKLSAAEGLERYLHQRYVGQKRFSLEGGDTMIPMLDQCIRRGGQAGVREIVIGMAHRGRLNVLVNTFGKKTAELFTEFEGKKVYSGEISGDVKYHLGFSSDMPTEGGDVHLSLGFNPSHLELIDPVVEGSVRARQDRRGDTARSTVLPILIHGDAACSGQGVVAETLNLSQLRGFSTGGSLHLVINNQVGFSISDPQDARSSRYSTDLAKFIDAPVFHVNGDDPEACVFATQLALDYRQTFKKDVFIDLVCYRRHGHNESDEPRATQPMMYRLIDAHPTTRALYAQQLEQEGVVTAAEAQAMTDEYRDALDAGGSVAEAVETDHKAAHWHPFVSCAWTPPAETGSTVVELQRLGEKLTAIPEDFKLHPRIAAVIKARVDMVAGTTPIDWGFAENLAYATLVTQGIRVRISGQDAGRGTFFHRHAILHNQATPDIPEGELYVPLSHVSSDQAPFELIDSTLSEEAVLGFEYGYSTYEPKALVMWEAQYGDFANGAQAVIDQFISAGETKWQRLSGLAMMLPHGYEGQGPEHSSARLERYLQLCAEQNMQVCVPSTPAQMFHMLRRQVLRSHRKPLIIMSPKSMLRHKLSVSSLEDLALGRFQEIIPDTRPEAGVDRVVLCSGKLYWELVEAREKHGLKNVAIVRIEQLYPFPEEQLASELARYPKAEVVWTQEEPHNQGAWHMIQDDLRACLAAGQTLSHSTRPRSASPAVGYAAKHNEQQQALISKALNLDVAVLVNP